MEFISSGKCTIVKDTEYYLEFTVESVHLSIVNAIRRTILSNIPTVVFRTFPHDIDHCVIHRNTTILNNEIIKHRIGSIVIHHVHTLPLEFMDSIMLEVKIENTTDKYLMVTSKDFKIKYKTNGTYIPEEEVRKIFPPSNVVLQAFGIESYTDLVKLRPKIHDMPGDTIHLTCDFSIGSSVEDSRYNVVSTCAYSYLRDEAMVASELDKKRIELESSGISSEEIQFKLKDWMLLDSYRIIQPNCFRFIVETLGVHTNKYIVTTAISIIVDILNNIENYIEIQRGNISTEYIILINKEDYTIGKLLETAMYAEYFENSSVLKFCGFKKVHPHDNYAHIRLEYTESLPENYQPSIITQIKESISPTIALLEHIKLQFD